MTTSRQAVALLPLPRWAHDLFGAEVTKAAAWCSRRSVVVRALTASGSELVELTASASALHAFRIDASRSPPSREPLAALDAIDPATRAELVRFVRRLRWMQAAEELAYEPTPEEVEQRRLARALMRIRAPEDAADLAVHDVSESALRAIHTYLQVLQGRWDPVFGATHDGLLPGSFDAFVRGIDGGVGAMIELAEKARDDRDDGFGILAGMAFEQSGFDDAAYVAYRRSIESMHGRERADLCLDLSRRCRARGLAEEAAAWARRALSIRRDDGRLVRRACFELIRCGMFDDAYLALREHSAHGALDRDVALDVAELLLWAARPEEARPYLERALDSRPSDARGLRCRGVLHALEGRWPEAREAFARALELAPRDTEAATWLVEASLRLGDREGAERQLAAARAVAQSPIHIVLNAALRTLDRARDDRELSALLALLDVPAEAWMAEADPVQSAARVLDRFGGNRGEVLTLVPRETSRDAIGLAPLRLPPSDSVLSSRDAAADTLKRVGTVPIDELDERFEALARRFEASPHPYCYWGELALWLGDYELAIERFEAALARAQARWGYVGQAAARILRGEYDAADAILAEGARHFAPVYGATTHVYVGEALRRRGDPKGAIEELTKAVEAKPTRAGAWMNLALAHLELGDEDAALRIYRSLEARLPRLYWDAWRALGEAPRWPLPVERMSDVFEKALELMRGNRSSHKITYFDAEGALRIARDAAAWRLGAARRASSISMGLQSRLAVGRSTRG